MGEVARASALPRWRRADQPVDRAVRSHLLPERRVRDAFVNVVLAKIALPLLRVKANEAVRPPNCASSTSAPAHVLPQDQGALSS
jgi:hypothetical protein